MLFSVSCCLYRACFTHLTSPNLSVFFQISTVPKGVCGCVYGRYAPDIKYYIGEVRSGQRRKAFALTTTTVQLLHFTHTPEAPYCSCLQNMVLRPRKMFTSRKLNLIMFSRVETIGRDGVGVDLFLCHLP